VGLGELDVCSNVQIGFPLRFRSSETLLTLGPEFSVTSVVDWSPDGRYVSYYAPNAKKGKGENWIVPLFGDRKPFQVAPVAASQYDGNFSPDGH